MIRQLGMTSSALSPMDVVCRLLTSCQRNGRVQRQIGGIEEEGGRESICGLMCRGEWRRRLEMEKNEEEDERRWTRSTDGR
jgi:hypothetical protein